MSAPTALHSKVHRMPPGDQGSEKIKIVEGIDEARYLVEAAGMAAVDFAPDERAAALRTLLYVIEGKLSDLSDRLHSAWRP